MNASNGKQKDFYASLDSIMDTRFGVVERLKPGHARKLIEEGKWHNRTSDFFPDIDREEFLKMYQAHEVETLENSVITNALQILFFQIKEYLTESLYMEIHPDNRPKLYINTFPYDFPEEIVNELRALVFIHVQRCIEVVIVNTPLSELTPKVCRDRFFIMLMYDYLDWINAHGQELHDILLREPRIGNLIINGPILFFNTDPEKDDETRDYIAQGINPLGLFERGLGVRLGIRLLDPDVFSVKYPDDRIMRREVVEESKPRTLDDFESAMKNQAANGGFTS